MQRVNLIVAGTLTGTVLVVCGLAAFGHQLGMSHGSLAWCQAVAGTIGAAALSMLPALLRAAESKVEAAVNPPKPEQVK